jgi:hypothetical protein
MSEFRPADLGETPTLEVRIYRDGVLVHSELCESEEDAAAAVEAWEQEARTTFEVADLSAQHHDVELLEVEPTGEEDHPTVAEEAPSSRIDAS